MPYSYCNSCGGELYSWREAAKPCIHMVEPDVDAATHYQCEYVNLSEEKARTELVEELERRLEVVEEYIKHHREEL